MKTMNLFWFSKEKLQNNPIRNFGDDINPILIEKISRNKVVWKNPLRQNFIERNFSKVNMAIGSILHFGSDNCNVWGSGLIDSSSTFPLGANYHAVRGPQTYKILKKAGCKVNAIFGDPALLLPIYFPQKNVKKYILGIIPHYTEVDDVHESLGIKNPNVKVVNLKDDPFTILKEINECEYIISSSLHGIIVGMAYGIPSLRIKLSDKIIGDGIKYEDFYQSVGINKHITHNIDINNLDIQNIINLIHRNKDEVLIQNSLVEIQNDLLSVKPF